MLEIEAQLRALALIWEKRGARRLPAQCVRVETRGAAQKRIEIAHG
jgi:hypothetical protein